MLENEFLLITNENGLPKEADHIRLNQSRSERVMGILPAPGQTEQAHPREAEPQLAQVDGSGTEPERSFVLFAAPLMPFDLITKSATAGVLNPPEARRRNKAPSAEIERPPKRAAFPRCSTKFWDLREKGRDIGPAPAEPGVAEGAEAKRHHHPW
jgi:hypothetical protein